MKQMFRPKLAMAMALILIICAAAFMYRDKDRQPPSADTISLLLPDALDEKDPHVQLWLDAAAEEGLHLRIVRESCLIRCFKCVRRD